MMGQKGAARRPFSLGRHGRGVACGKGCDVGVRGNRAAVYTAASLGVCGVLLWAAQGVLYPGGWGAVLRIGPLWVGLWGVIGALGAGLGWMLFRPGKSPREAVADVLLVACAQGLVLAAGLVVMAQAAPVRLVWAVDHFEVVSPMELVRGERPYPLSEQLQVARSGLQLRQLRLPQDAQARQALLFAEVSGLVLAARTELHGPYRFEAVHPHAHTAAEVPEPEARAALAQAIAAQQACPRDEVVWGPLKSRRGFHTALLHRSDGRVCDVIDLDLWRR